MAAVIPETLASPSPSRRPKRLATWVASLWTLAGVALFGVYGWNYAQQTIFVNQHHLPQYHPKVNGSIPALWPTLPGIGTKIGQLLIPAVHINTPVVQGTGWNQLALGAGHYNSSALPGQIGNDYVAGHRDTVFTQLKNVKKGDLVIFSTPYGKFVYKAVSFQIVPQSDTSVLDPTPYQTLTLQTCYPFSFFGFAPDRYIVHTKLVSEPKNLPS
ncbi:sortase [Alicyclobacillus tolerans]|uniref:sortase n=1 Tax=Alicyclobacillus tolerans TaxID=90970 RepID=UPI001F007851|nr:sortase [Alicyclobacillus tolerans]MCF8566489.1 sortase [Alicyclobacillus tolerans]